MSCFHGTVVPARLAFLLATCLATPAMADHAGPTAVGSGGGGLTVLDSSTLDAGEASAGFRMLYTRPDQRTDAELEALAAQHIHAHNTDHNLNASAGVAYGVTHHLTVSVELPYVRRDGLREAEHSHSGGQAINDVEQLGNVSGFGDMSVLAKYRLTHSESGGLALIGGLKMPTGSTHKNGLDGERLETEHQPGTGSWDSIAGAAGGVKLGTLQLNASVLYQFSGKGAQDTRLGDRAQGGFSLSHRFGPHEHHHDDADEGHDHGEHGHEAHHGHQSWDAFVEVSGEWEGRQKVNGQIEEASGGRAVWLTPGARFNTANGFTIAAAIGVPVWENIRPSHPDNNYRLALALGHGL